MLLNLHKKSWMDGLALQDFNTHCSTNENTVKVCLIQENISLKSACSYYCMMCQLYQTFSARQLKNFSLFFFSGDVTAC